MRSAARIDEEQKSEPGILQDEAWLDAELDHLWLVAERRRLVGAQQPHRVRIEGKHNRRPAHLLGLGGQSLDDPRMALMHAVEISDGNGAGPKLAGQIIDVTK